jgi:hypothetical protein
MSFIFVSFITEMFMKKIQIVAHTINYGEDNLIDFLKRRSYVDSANTSVGEQLS